MRKADLVNQISEKTGIPKVDVLMTLETAFREIKESLSKGENIYIRGFGSFITKKRAAKIGRNIKKNIAVHIPEHFIPAFKPAKEFVADVKKPFPQSNFAAPTTYLRNECMKKPQWITLSIALLLVISLFAATQQYFFGDRQLKISANNAHSKDDGHNHGNEQQGISTDSIIYYAKQNLPPTQVAYLAQLENSIVRGNVPEQKLHLMHQLARFWADSAGSVTPMAWYPYAWYTAEAARLENSENSLSFAAHKFLERLTVESTPQVKQWEALQAKDLFERSLKLNPSADSAKVGLGATILYGGLGTPMAGISLIREVVEKDSTNVFAQLTLGEASLVSGQLEKAIERFKIVVRLNPANLQAGLMLADSYEKMQKWTEAVQSYKRVLPFVSNPAMKAEVEKRIIELKTK